MVIGINYERIELLYAFPIIWLVYSVSMFELRKRSSIVDVLAKVNSSLLYEVFQHWLFLIDIFYLFLFLFQGGWFFLVIAIYIFGFILNPIFGIRGVKKVKRRNGNDPILLLKMFLFFSFVIILQTSSLLLVTYIANKLNLLGLGQVALAAFGLIAVTAYSLKKKRIGPPKALGATAVCCLLSLIAYFQIGYHVFGWTGLLK